MWQYIWFTLYTSVQYYGGPDATSKFILHFCIFLVLDFQVFDFQVFDFSVFDFSVFDFSVFDFLVFDFQVPDFCFELNFSYKATLT